MTTSVSFIWAPYNLSARSVRLGPVDNTLLIPVFDRHVAWSVDTTTGVLSQASTTISDNLPFFEQASSYGYIDMCILDSTTYVLLSSDSRLGYNSTLNANTFACSPGNGVPNQIAWTGTELLVINTSGTVYSTSSLSGGGTLTYTLLGSFPAYACNTAYYNGFLYGTVGSTAQMSKMDVSSGAVTNVTTPMTFPSAIAASSYGDAVIGFSNFTLGTGYIAMQASPGAPGTLGVGARATASSLDVLTGNSNGWTVASTVTTTAQPIALTWTPTDEQVLVTESGGVVQVFNNTGGTLTASQSLTVANAGAIAVTSDSLNALVTQGASNEVTVLTNNLNTWSVGTTVTGLTAAGPVVMTSNTTAIVGVTNGLAFLTRSGSVWSITSTATLSFTPLSLAYDSLSGNTYASGTLSGSGYTVQISPTNAVTNFGSWTGSGDMVITTSNRVLVLSEASSQVIMIPVGSAQPTAEIVYMSSPVTSPTGLFLNNIAIWVSSSTTAASYSLLGHNGTLAPIRTGYLSVYNEGSSSWSTHSFGVTVIPTAVYWDTTGNLFTTDLKNNLTQFSATATITSTVAIGEYTGQPAGTPLGMSDIIAFNNDLYITTSLSGVLIQVTGLS